jgi:hypothetical protein
MMKLYIRGCIAFDPEQAQCVVDAGKLGTSSAFVQFEQTKKAALSSRIGSADEPLDPRVATSHSTWHVFDD